MEDQEQTKKKDLQQTQKPFVRAVWGRECWNGTRDRERERDSQRKRDHGEERGGVKERRVGQDGGGEGRK